MPEMVSEVPELNGIFLMLVLVVFPGSAVLEQENRTATKSNGNTRVEIVDFMRYLFKLLINLFISFSPGIRVLLFLQKVYLKISLYTIKKAYLLLYI
jgi:hypothetical protein